MVASGTPCLEAMLVQMSPDLTVYDVPTPLVGGVAVDCGAPKVPVPVLVLVLVPVLVPVLVGARLPGPVGTTGFSVSVPVA